MKMMYTVNPSGFFNIRGCRKSETSFGARVPRVFHVIYAENMQLDKNYMYHDCKKCFVPACVFLPNQSALAVTFHRAICNVDIHLLHCYKFSVQ